MLFRFPRSHAFPGGEVVVEDDGKAGPECLVEFGDGVAVVAQWHPDGDAVVLSIDDYQTASGTTVTARTWRIAQGEGGAWRATRLS